MPLFLLLAVLALVFHACVFVALCREPKCRRTFHVWYIRGRVRQIRATERASENVRRAA
jgi:hypothetical protein